LAWKREKAVPARREIVTLLGNGDETSRTALLQAAKNSEAKIRVAAIEGLAKLKHDSASEGIFRAAWANPKEAYGARKAALRGLVAWKVKDADQLLGEALQMPADRHSIAATALELMLKTPGPKARELAALYCQYGQPRALRSEAVAALGRLAKDDGSLEDILVTLVDDPDRIVRFRAWSAVRELKLKKAIPALKARLGQESTGFIGFAKRMIEDTLEALKENEPQAVAAEASESSRTIAELDRQAIDLENKARELRNAIESLKSKAARASSVTTPSPTGSH
jgi:aminopeptidase N